jgi:hypothetical protein
MKYVFAIALLALTPTLAMPCSCLEIATIEASIEAEPLLVEARVVALEEYDSKQYGHQVHSVTLEVRKVFKGSVKTKTIVVEHWMCYSSLYLELMKVNHSYLLPLSVAENGKHQLAGCAHSGLELVDGKLFTFEQTEGSGRRLQFYKTYEDFLRQFEPVPMTPNKSLERTRAR